MHAFVPTLPPALRTSTSTPSTAQLSERYVTDLPTDALGPRPAHPQLRPLPTASSPTTFASPSPPTPLSFPRPTVIWLRTDLRLDDHPALHAAVVQNHPIAPLYILPFSSSPSAALFAALRDLRSSLRTRGAELYVRRCGPSASLAETVAAFCAETRAGGLHFHRGVGSDERREEKEVAAQVEGMGVAVRGFWTGALVCPDELPFELEWLPEDCDSFARRVVDVPVRKPIEAPGRVRGVCGVSCGAIAEGRGSGGERLARERMGEYVAGKSLVSVGSGRGKGIETRFARLGAFLNMGCLSPRRLYWEVVHGVGEQSVRRFCAEFELVLRDFVRLVELKKGGGGGGGLKPA